MDDALVLHTTGLVIVPASEVLILVLMDDALVPKWWEKMESLSAVLILVLMDDALVLTKHQHMAQLLSLNPCFNG